MAREISSNLLAKSLQFAIAWMFVAGVGPLLGQNIPSAWPMQGRTAARTGRTDAIGPQTPTIAWQIQVDFSQRFTILEAAPVIDDHGLLFAGRVHGVTAVDVRTRSVQWTVTDPLRNTIVPGSPAIWGDFVLWGDMSGATQMYCADKRTGEIVWEEPDHWVYAPAVTETGTVFFTDQLGSINARDIVTGDEIWTVASDDAIRATLSIAPNGWIITPYDDNPGSDEVAALNPKDGSFEWRYDIGGELNGAMVVDRGRVYVGSRDGRVYVIDALTGDEIGRSPFLDGIIRGAVCVAEDGTVYTGTTTGATDLIALSPTGQVQWRAPLPAWIKNAPIVAGDGTIYVTSNRSSNEEGWVHAFRSDGTEIWSHQMPRHVYASPTLGPDGTLYVLCRDSYLYAFHDGPNPAATLNGPCPGSATLDILGATPNATIAILFASDRGQTDIPSGFVCEGTTIHLNATARVVETATTDGNGNYSTSGQLPAAACGGYVQVIDLTSCHVSNLVAIP